MPGDMHKKIGRASVISNLRGCLKIKFDSTIGIKYYPKYYPIWSMCTEFRKNSISEFEVIIAYYPIVDNGFYFKTVSL